MVMADGLATGAAVVGVRGLGVEPAAHPIEKTSETIITTSSDCLRFIVTPIVFLRI